MGRYCSKWDGYFPAYLSSGRLITISKASSSTVELDQICPIVVMSHSTKVLEKAILNNIKSIGSDLLKTGKYLTGFKTNLLTQSNLSIVLQNI